MTHLLLANIAVLIAVFAVSRLAGRRLVYGLVGVALVVYQVAFGYLAGRLTVLEAILPVVGVALLVADMRGVLPRWTLLGRRRRAGDG